MNLVLLVCVSVGFDVGVCVGVDVGVCVGRVLCRSVRVVSVE
jgi:hypothetical protein